jgi:ABC-type multidrug transport system fused ATPase/permease subunit
VGTDVANYLGLAHGRAAPGKAGRPMPNSLYAYVWRVSGRAQIFLSLLSVVVFLLDLVPLELQRRIVNDAIERRALSRLAWLSLAYVVVVLAQGGSKLALNVYRSAVSEKTSQRLRLDTYDKALLRPPDAGEPKEGIGVSIILSEVDPVGGFIGTSVSEPVLHAGVLLTVFAYMLHLQAWMALVSFAIFAPQLAFVPLLQEAINRRTEARIRVLRRLSVNIVDDDSPPCRGATAFRNRVGSVYRLNMQIFRRKFSMNFLMNALHHCGIAAVLFVGGWFVIQGTTQVGTVVAFISGLSRINDPWGDLVNYFRDLTNARVKYRLIARVLNEATPDPAEAAASKS